MTSRIVVGSGYIESPLLLNSPEVVGCIDAGRDHLERFWKTNVERYFSKSQRYNFIVSKFGKVTFTPFKYRHSGRMQSACEVKWNRYDHRVSIRFLDIINPKDGQEYMAKLISGTGTTPGAFDPALGIRIKTGVRHGTSNDQWTDWMNMFGKEMDSTMVTMADCIIPRLPEQVQEAVTKMVKATEEF